MIDYKDPNKPVIRQPTISLPDVSTDMPEQVHCPYCNKQVLTRIQRRYGLAAGLISAAICAGGFIFSPCCLCCCFWCGCPLIPCWIDDIKDAKHYCPYCDNYLGYYYVAQTTEPYRRTHQHIY